MTTYSYYVGVDLGQRQDYTAVAILEEPAWVPDWLAESRRLVYELGLVDRAGWVSPAELSPSGLREVLALNYREGRPAGAPLSLRHLERFPLGTPYPKIVERIGSMLATPPLLDRSTALLVDSTGVGGGVVDMFVHAGLDPIPVIIHGGDKVSSQEPGFRTPKRDLVAAVQVLLQNERLKIARALPEADTLRRELQNFKVKIDPKTSHDSYSHWREEAHDDLVLATALAAWFRGWWNSHLDTRDALTTRR